MRADHNPRRARAGPRMPDRPSTDQYLTDEAHRTPNPGKSRALPSSSRGTWMAAIFVVLVFGSIAAYFSRGMWSRGGDLKVNGLEQAAHGAVDTVGVLPVENLRGRLRRLGAVGTGHGAGGNPAPHPGHRHRGAGPSGARARRAGPRRRLGRHTPAGADLCTRSRSRARPYVPPRPARRAPGVGTGGGRRDGAGHAQLRGGLRAGGGGTTGAGRRRTHGPRLRGDAHRAGDVGRPVFRSPLRHRHARTLHQPAASRRGSGAAGCDSTRGRGRDRGPGRSANHRAGTRIGLLRPGGPRQAHLPPRQTAVDRRASSPAQAGRGASGHPGTPADRAGGGCL